MEHVLTMANLKLKPSLFTPRPIEDGQRPNCRLKISIIIIEDVIGRLTNYYIGTVHKHLLWGNRMQKSGS